MTKAPQPSSGIPGLAGGIGDPWWVKVMEIPGPGALYQVFHNTNTAEHAWFLSSGAYAGFPTKAQAKAWVAQDTHGLLGNVNRAVGGAAHAASGAAHAAAGAASSLGKLNNVAAALTNRDTWLRVAEVVIGMALLIVGVAHMAEGTAVGRAAYAVGKKAALL